MRRHIRWGYALRAAWYRWRYGIETRGMDSTVMPFVERGTYVDVVRRGPFTDVVRHAGNVPGVPQGTLRFIPTQYNHGFMVEFWQEGRLRGRTVLSYDAVYRLLFRKAGEVMPREGPRGEVSR